MDLADRFLRSALGYPLLVRLRLQEQVRQGDRERGGHVVLPVKGNRGALSDALDALPWKDAEIAHVSTGKGHGRITTRTIQVETPSTAKTTPVNAPAPAPV